MRLLCLLVCFVIPTFARYYYDDEDYARNFLSRKQNDYKRSYYDNYDNSNFNHRDFSRSADDESSSSRKRLLNLLSDIVEYSKRDKVVDGSFNEPDLLLEPSIPKIPKIQKHNLLMPGVAPEKVYN